MRDDSVLVLQVSLNDGRRFWLLPGGGREPDDASAEACDGMTRSSDRPSGAPR